ncbi:cobaltochelatase subunit CobN [Pseudoxanthomonas broegbernensis]|uniref:cobaltochelatase subunit CobN n=1 Tax=Pseudoxanthomonas broegbernensis TaxID=83619 RepID=UPI0017D8FFF3|nr:cobaltochelatase subunit CobN [Pseudoxanthomonas broegbernensis]MBB6064978.1 cobaltochelatase CobN [Pseudoxanthomonas broegbernensis]
MLLLGWCWAASAAEPPVRVKVLSNDFVLPGKVARLHEWGAEAGVAFERVAIEHGGDPGGRVAGADLLLLDTPRPSDRAQVQAWLDGALESTRTPWIQVGGGRPAAGGLPEDVAMRLAGYYAAGGEANFRHLVDAIARWRRGGDLAAVPPPRPLPRTGYYDPAAPTVFASAAEYLAWRGGPATDDGARVAVLVSPGSVASMQTAVVDALIQRGAAHGVQVFGLWFDDDDPQGLTQALRGLPVAVIVNLTHLQNDKARAEEFLALDVPVLQALNYRQGDPAHWRGAASGVSPSLVATFLAVPEGWGASDPMVLGAVEHGESVAIPEQVEALAAKLARLVALRAKPAADKHVALMFWNAPEGEKNLSASHLNVPRSLVRLGQDLRAAGYQVQPMAEADLIEKAQAMLGGYYRPQSLDALLARGLAAAFPVARYRRWLDTLPPAQRQALLQRWGEPETHPAVRRIDGEPAFVFPRLQLGQLLVMPQPPRAGQVGQATHDTASLPSHYYLAAYQFVREGFAADALIHFGTHGTQEWTPGKDRGLWVNDYPFLAVGDLPVFYPYIQDNVGEAVQAKRRGRAVTISHQTPAFAPAGLYDELRDLHALVHEYQQLDEGDVRERTRDALRDAALAAGIAGDIGWSRAAIDADFPRFFGVLHEQLHELARGAMPLGLHTFGEAAMPDHRLGMVLQQLGEPYLRALGVDPAEAFAEDFQVLAQGEPYRLLRSHLREGIPLDTVSDPALRAQLQRALELDRALADPQEAESLLRGLAGGFVPPGAGGDPVRNPDLRSGRNLYPFEPDRIPTRAAYEAGGQALEQLLATYRDAHGGRAPDKLAFSLWSSEAIRHLGVLESQVLHALGLRPVWDPGGRVTALEIVPEVELARPRIDAVVQVTSVYRDQFDGFMRLLADAIDRLAAQQAPHAIARNTGAVARALAARGLDPGRARQLAALRIFSNAPGEYGSGLPDAVLSERTDKSDAALADQFLSRLQYAYGARDWGLKLDTPGQGNLFAEQLRGVQAAVLARSSNTHGLLSTDHPFEYLGGLSLAVRHLDGASPDLYVSDLRGGTAKTTTAARFIADELRSRQLNPHWIGEMQKEGYAGTLAVLDTVDNLFGWQVTDPGSVRAEQWQALHDTYVRDVRRLGVDAWFGKHNPTAQAQLIVRMREAIARGYWQADAATVAELEQRLQMLTRASAEAVQSAARGYGTAQVRAQVPRAAQPPADASPAAAPDDTPAAAADPATPVRGRIMQETPLDPPPARSAWHPLAGLLALALCLLAGVLAQARGNARLPHPQPLR